MGRSEIAMRLLVLLAVVAAVAAVSNGGEGGKGGKGAFAANPQPKPPTRPTRPTRHPHATPPPSTTEAAEDSALCQKWDAEKAQCVCHKHCIDRTRFSSRDMCSNTTGHDCTGCNSYNDQCNYCHNLINKTDTIRASCFKCRNRPKMGTRKQGTVPCRVAVGNKSVNAWGACTACHEECGDRLVVMRTHTDTGEYVPLGNCFNGVKPFGLNDGPASDGKCLPQCFNPETGNIYEISVSPNRTANVSKLICTKACESAASFKLQNDAETMAYFNLTSGDPRVWVKCNLFKVTQCGNVAGPPRDPEPSPRFTLDKLDMLETYEEDLGKGGKGANLGLNLPKTTKHAKKKHIELPQIATRMCNVTREVSCNRYKIGADSKWTKPGEFCPPALCETVAITA